MLGVKPLLRLRACRSPSALGAAALSAAALLCLGGCSPDPLGTVVEAQAPPATAVAAPARDGDYLAPELRREVEALIVGVGSAPTTAATCGERARLLWRWANAWALTGRPLSQDSIQMLANVSALEARGERCPSRLVTLLDEEVRELALRDREPEAFGSLRFAGERVFGVDEWVTVEQVFTAGSRGVAVGGGFLLGSQIMADQSDLQNSDPGGEGYVSARCSNPAVRLEATTTPLGGRHGGFKQPKQMPVFRVAGAPLGPGDTVTFTYGDRVGGARGLRLQTVSTDNLLLPIYVDLEGRDRFAALDWPALEVVGAPEIAAVSVLAPSVVARGERFDLAVRTEDRYRNRTTGAVPGYRVLLDGEAVATVPRGAAAAAVVEGLRIDEPGTHRFSVRSLDGLLVASSNPVWVEENPARRIFWGELHGHAGFAEGQGGPDQFFRYARDDARLDFVSLTDHDTNLDDFEWRTLQESTRRYHRDGEFVAFLGYEWSAHRELGGHHNVFFRSSGAKRVPRQEAPVLDALYPRLSAENGADNVLVIPHAHNAADWNRSDSGVERLVEIASMHGTFEWFGNLYLRNGFDIGFIAASDDHRSKPGLATGLFFAPQVQPGGLAAAVAPDKTGDAVFDALRGLSAYATSGERILLDVRLNGEPMGSRQASSARRRIEARVSGTAPIDRVDVVKNGEVAWSESYLLAPPASHSWVQVAFESSSEVLPPYTDATGPRDNPREYRLWSGTLEVEGARLVGLRTTGLKNAYLDWARVDPAEPNRIRFRTETRGRAESLLVELEGASADTRLVFAIAAAQEIGFEQGVRPLADIPAVDVGFSLADLDGARLEHPLPVGAHQDRLVLQTVDVEGALDRVFEYTDLGEARDGDYYYLRVTQLDGSQAWSSPCWVGRAERDAAPAPSTGSSR